ncbi:MAG: HIT domain-containing protein [Candidatus Gracilibacteria bacterium]|nr:HIT domain-containing protein [Candidatus Gracilibacteria bacterium]
MTIFSKIIAGEISAPRIYEDELVIVIKDIAPEKKTHLLIIPKKEIPTLNDIDENDKELMSHMFYVAKKVAKDVGVEKAYRLRLNVGDLQDVMHIHMHLLSDLG